jgi:hypothetical protein
LHQALRIKTKEKKVKMENVNVAIINIRTKKHELAKSKASAKHSVGNRKYCTNAIDELSYKNEIIVLGKKVLGSDEAEETVKNYIDNLKPDCNYSDEDVKNRSRQKSKLRSWLKAAKTSESEKNVFNNLMEKLENNEIIDDELLSDFEKIDDKISRRNDKIKSLKSLQKNHNKIINSEQRGQQLDVITVEKVFKITSKSNFEMDAIEQRKMQQSFHEKHFPNYAIIYTAAHYDESKGHCHLMHSGKNSANGKFDYPDAECKVVQNYMKKNAIDSSSFGKTWGEYSEVELREHGEQWQNMNYENANNILITLGIIDKQFKKLEGDEKEEAHNKIKQDPTARKRITNREYNNAELNKITSEDLRKDIKEQVKNLDKNDDIIRLKVICINELDEEIEEKNGIVKRFNEEIKSLVRITFKYIDSFFNKNNKEKSEKLAQVTAKIVNNAIDILPKTGKVIENKIKEIDEKLGNADIQNQMRRDRIKRKPRCSICGGLADAGDICIVCTSEKMEREAIENPEKKEKKKKIKYDI